eukprot:1447137-Rhodomonas_salina.1
MLRRLQGLQPGRDRAGRGVASSGVRHGVLRHGRRQLLPAPDGADGDGRRPCERHAHGGPARRQSRPLSLSRAFSRVLCVACVCLSRALSLSLAARRALALSLSF